MELSVQQGNIADAEVDLIVVNLFAGVGAPAGATGAVDRALDGEISQLIATEDFTGEAETTALLYARGRLTAPRVLVVGLGGSGQFGVAQIRRAGAVGAQAAARVKGVKTIATIVHGAGIVGHDADAAAQEGGAGHAAGRLPPQTVSTRRGGPGLDELHCGRVQRGQTGRR